MNTSKIKFRLEVWENSVVFQVLEMDERFRNYANSFNAKNKINIYSFHWVEISETCIYLRGEKKDGDFDVCKLSFENAKDAEEFANKILVALKDWSENWEGFKDEKKTDGVKYYNFAQNIFSY